MGHASGLRQWKPTVGVGSRQIIEESDDLVPRFQQYAKSIEESFGMPAGAVDGDARLALLRAFPGKTLERRPLSAMLPDDLIRGLYSLPVNIGTIGAMLGGVIAGGQNGVDRLVVAVHHIVAGDALPDLRELKRLMEHVRESPSRTNSHDTGIDEARFPLRSACVHDLQTGGVRALAGEVRILHQKNIVSRNGIKYGP